MDEAALRQKETPARTPIAGEEKAAPHGFRGQMDRTVGARAAADLKLNRCSGTSLNIPGPLRTVLVLLLLALSVEPRSLDGRTAVCNMVYWIFAA